MTKSGQRVRRAGASLPECQRRHLWFGRRGVCCVRCRFGKGGREQSVSTMFTSNSMVTAVQPADWFQAWDECCCTSSQGAMCSEGLLPCMAAQIDAHAMHGCGFGASMHACMHACIHLHMGPFLKMRTGLMEHGMHICCCACTPAWHFPSPCMGACSVVVPAPFSVH